MNSSLMEDNLSGMFAIGCLGRKRVCLQADKQILREEWRGLFRNAGSIFFHTKGISLSRISLLSSFETSQTPEKSTAGQLRIDILTVLSIIGGDNLILYKLYACHLSYLPPGYADTCHGKTMECNIKHRHVTTMDINANQMYPVPSKMLGHSRLRRKIEVKK